VGYDYDDKCSVQHDIKKRGGWLREGDKLIKLTQAVSQAVGLASQISLSSLVQN